MLRVYSRILSTHLRHPRKLYCGLNTREDRQALRIFWRDGHLRCTYDTEEKKKLYICITLESELKGTIKVQKGKTSL